MPKSYEFKPLKPLNPGCGYGRYWGNRTREYGRKMFNLCIQEHPEDFEDDLWGPGNLDVNDV